MCVGMCVDMRTDICWACATHHWKALVVTRQRVPCVHMSIHMSLPMSMSISMPMSIHTSLRMSILVTHILDTRLFVKRRLGPVRRNAGVGLQLTRRRIPCGKLRRATRCCTGAHRPSPTACPHRPSPTASQAHGHRRGRVLVLTRPRRELSRTVPWHMPQRMSVCMSIRMSIHMSVHMCIHMCIHMSIYMSIHMSIHMSVHMSLHIKQ